MGKQGLPIAWRIRDGSGARWCCHAAHVVDLAVTQQRDGPERARNGGADVKPGCCWRVDYG
jgi:hypothetical protein